MIKRNAVFVCCVLLSTQLFAFPCTVTLVKDSCWTNFNVNMVVTDVQSGKPITTILVPKGTSWKRGSFECQPSQKIIYSATFDPAIWEGTEGRIYNAQQYWALPESFTSSQKAWEIPVCFPSAFAEVPMPATGSGNCICDFTSVPAIPPVLERAR